MRKPIVIIILAAVGLAVSIWLIWYAFQPRQSQTNNSSNATQNTSTEPNQNGSATDNSASENLNQAVTIQDFAFSPATMTVKKGTTITWTNQDSANHNVVADDASNSGGLPTSADLLSKGETFSHTFNEVGIFAYHCSPHPNMKGTIEVVE